MTLESAQYSVDHTTKNILKNQAAKAVSPPPWGFFKRAEAYEANPKTSLKTEKPETRRGQTTTDPRWAWAPEETTTLKPGQAFYNTEAWKLGERH